jgi:hypothetical protein
VNRGKKQMRDGVTTQNYGCLVLTLIATLQEKQSGPVDGVYLSKKSFSNSTDMKADLGSFRDLNVRTPASASIISSFPTFWSKYKAADKSFAFSLPTVARR